MRSVNDKVAEQHEKLPIHISVSSIRAAQKCFSEQEKKPTNTREITGYGQSQQKRKLGPVRRASMEPNI